MKPLGWAIVGPGSIAGRFADTVSRLPETRLAAVLGRADLARLDRIREGLAAFRQDTSTPAAVGRLLTDAALRARFAVEGRKTIEQAVRAGCHTPKALGAQLKCGTNCGSCVPELKTIIAQALAPA